MIIKEGGAISNLSRVGLKGRLEEIMFCHESTGDDHAVIHLWLNGDMLSYLSVGEAVELRNELNVAIKGAVGI